MADSIFADGWKATPYWWELAPRPDWPQIELPRKVDVAIVGSGYAGMSAALHLTRAGRDVVVLEAREPGHGASSRSGGMAGSGLKLGYSDLKAKYGQQRAVDMVTESERSLEFFEDFLAGEQIQCHYQKVGRFIGAHAPSDYEAMARGIELVKKEAGLETGYMIPRAEQHSEVKTDAYHGGKATLAGGGLHPAIYHQQVLDRVRQAGIKIAAHTPVTAIARSGKGFEVTTSRGKVLADNVCVMTNGYTPPAAQDLRRRLVPVGSYIIATEEIGEERITELFPHHRMIADTKHILYYYRPSPDRKRVIFGGRAKTRDIETKESGEILHKFMCGIFPELKDVKVTHSWTGNVAFAFDKLPHIGVRDGIHYALACNGSGVVKQTYFGYKTAMKILGKAEGKTAFDDMEFTTIPFYDGNPWFLPIVQRWYQFLDARAK
ncbi:MAG: FAD-binding oxidoreductase [Proteobacteria bacterium]|nr:FAD-binding oxidoreductase [Pseudomonadota bacterium]MDA1070697.1 FAD-binding oxidoreductase [Pseudomonadota bacterium]